MSNPDWRGKELAVPPSPMDDIAQCPVVYVEDAVPDDAAVINATHIAVVDVVVEGRGE